LLLNYSLSFIFSVSSSHFLLSIHIDSELVHDNGERIRERGTKGREWDEETGFDATKRKKVRPERGDCPGASGRRGIPGMACVERVAQLGGQGG
jgi:hypothetical protein